MTKTTHSISALVNQTVNLIWTALFFSPVLIFWIHHWQVVPFIIMLSVSLIPVMIPHRYYNYLHASKTRRFYENAFIPELQSVTQYGSRVKKLARNLGGHEDTLSQKKLNIKKLKGQIRVYESYHLVCFLFFLLTATYSIAEKEYIIAALITVSNILYNVVPVLIQQYNKIRLGAFVR